jgi:hypothetical protein
MRWTGTTKVRTKRETSATDVEVSAHRFAAVAALFAVLVGVGVLIAWQCMGHPEFRAWATLVSTRPNTAVGFVAAGLALLLLTRRTRRHVAFPMGWTLALVPVLIGGLTIAEYAGVTRLNIDELIVPVEAILADAADGVGSGQAEAVRDRAGGSDAVGDGSALGAAAVVTDGESASSKPYAPARVPSLSAASFVMLGLGLLLLQMSPGASQLLGIATLWLGLLATLGHLFGVENLSGWGTPAEMAPEAALTFCVLSLGLLLARPQQGPVAVLLAADAGGVAARRLLPPVMAVLVLSGALVIYGE